MTGRVKAMRVAVLCIGNELLMDEGVGPACARYIQARYELPEQVEVLDRSVMGMAILSDLRSHDFALVIDALEVPDAEPGQLFSFAPQDAAPTPAGMTSLHEVRFADVLGSAELLGIRCAGHCLGVQVENMSPSEFVMALTPRVAAAVPFLAQAAMRYLNKELGAGIVDLLPQADACRAGSGTAGARSFSRGWDRMVEQSASVQGEVCDRVAAVLPAVYGTPDATVARRYLACGLKAIGLDVHEVDDAGACGVQIALPALDPADEESFCAIADRFGLALCSPSAVGGLCYMAWVSPLITDYDCDELIGSCLAVLEGSGQARLER